MNSKGQPPDWYATYRGLRAEIDAGALPPGHRLPTISALAKARSISPHGARRALEKLRRDGVVESRQGHGFRVAERRHIYEIGHRPRFSQTMARRGLHVSTDVLPNGGQQLPQLIPDNVTPCLPRHVTSADLLRKIEGRPVALSHVHFPADRFDRVIEALEDNGSVTRALTEMGVCDYVRKSTHIDIRLPTKPEADALRIATTQPVFVTTGIDVAAHDPDDVIEFNQSVWRIDCWKITFAHDR